MKKLNFLFIDDETRSSDIIEYGQKIFGYKITFMRSLEAAKQALLKFKFDAIVLDIMFFHATQSQYYGRKAGIIFVKSNSNLLDPYIKRNRLFVLSGATTLPFKSKLFELGIPREHFIEKPVSMSHFWTIINANIKD